MVFARLALTVVGVLVALIGLIWIGQGSGYFPYPASSFMINQTPWMLRGAIALVVGLVVVWAARRFVRERSSETVGAAYPLCPAGHLPHRWGDRLVATSRSSLTLRLKWGVSAQPISPPVGEMSGRTEG